MQAEILDKQPEAMLRLYVIWFNVLPADSREAWHGRLITDPSATHYWDAQTLVGSWFANAGQFSHGSLAWDVYYLYGAEAVWEDEPEPLVGSGYTVFGTRSRLIEELEGLYDS